MYQLNPETKARATAYFNTLMTDADVDSAEVRYGIKPQQFFAYKRGSMIPGLRIMYALQKDSGFSLDCIDPRINEGVDAAMALEPICEDEAAVMPMYIQRVSVRRILADTRGKTNARSVAISEIIAFADRYERSCEHDVVEIDRIRDGVNKRIWRWVDSNFGFTFANSLKDIGGNKWEFETKNYRCVIRLLGTGRIAFQSYFKKEAGECESVCREFDLQ